MGVAWVLAGGAARGAYEAGVLRYLLTDLADRLGYVPWPDVVTGTSVGALNGVMVAARSRDGLDKLCRVWTELEFDDVVRAPATGLFTATWFALRDRGPFTLLDATPLQRMVVSLFPYADLRAAIDSGATRAFIASATDLAGGSNALFIDAGEHEAPRVLPGTYTIRTRVGPRHMLASAALPFLFPPVQIGDRTYVDGGIRQSAQLRPAMLPGIDKVLLIGVRQRTGAIEPRGEVRATLPYLLGQTLNAVHLDPVERDLWQLERENEVIAWGRARYGPEFEEELAVDLGRIQLSALVVRPTRDLGEFAARTWLAQPPDAPALLRTLAGWLVDEGNPNSGDLLSYLYFDKAYTGQLEALGFHDAAARGDELAAFLARS